MKPKPTKPVVRPKKTGLRPRGLNNKVENPVKTNHDAAEEIITRMYFANRKKTNPCSDDQLKINIFEKVKGLVTHIEAMIILSTKSRTRVVAPIKQPATTTPVDTFSRAVAKIRVLGKNHYPDEEADQYNDVIKAIGQLNVELKEMKDFYFYESPDGVWYPFWLRFKERTVKVNSMVSTNKAWYWKNINLSVTTVTKQIGALLRATEESKKPIIFLTSGQQHIFKKNIGHGVAIVIFRNEKGTFAILKDCLDLKEIKIPEKVKEVLLKNNVHKILPVGELECEEVVANSDCAKECYKTVARILDGNYFKTTELIGRTKEWLDLKTKCKLKGPVPIPIDQLAMTPKVILEKINISPSILPSHT